MKIAVYTIETVKPKNIKDEEDILDIFNLPSLKYGTAEFIGKFSYWITKSELKKMPLVSQRYYDRKCNIWRHGVLLLEPTIKLFAECII